MRLTVFVAATLVIVGSLLALAPPSAQAHPGGTDGNGCHTCRTNCTERWGISYGFYHRHHPVRPCFASLEPLEPIQPIEPIIPIRPAIPTPPPNQLPEVSLSGPQTIEEGYEAHFRADAYDNDGFIRTYQWAYGDGTLKTTDSALSSHEFSSPGRYKVTVTVTDDDGGRRSATEYVEVEGKKWPLSREVMTWIVIGGVVGLLVLWWIIASIINTRRSARR